MENLSHYRRPTVALVITGSDQATRRAVVWQQCGSVMGANLPAKVTPDASLNDIIPWTDELAENVNAYRRKLGLDPDMEPKPDPCALYPGHLRAAMPQPSGQVKC